MTERRRSAADVVFALAVMAVAAATWREASTLPPPLYDPLGPGSVPTWLCMALLALGGILLVRAALGRRIGQATQSLILGVSDGAPTDYRLRPLLAVLGFALTVAYVAALGAGMRFLWSTMAFLAALGIAMGDRSRRQVAIALAVAAVGAVAIDYLFRRVFVVDLP